MPSIFYSYIRCGYIYVFNAIDSQTVMLDVSKNTSDIIKLMTGIAFRCKCFCVNYIRLFNNIRFYFLIKRRNKEFGVYLTLGMEKRKISLVLFFETLIIGIIFPYSWVNNWHSIFSINEHSCGKYV